MYRKIGVNIKEKANVLRSEGYTYREISQELDVSLYTVYNAINKKRKKYYQNHKNNTDYFEKKGFKDFREYNNYLEQQRIEQPENIALSRYITHELGKLKKSQGWLSKRIGMVTHQSVSDYILGKKLPSKEVLETLFIVFDAPYRTIDDLLKDEMI
jgi:hypothetical protein